MWVHGWSRGAVKGSGSREHGMVAFCCLGILNTGGYLMMLLMMVIGSFQDALCTSHFMKRFRLPVRLLQQALSDGNISHLSEEHLTTRLTTTQPGVVDMEPKQGHALDLAANPLQIAWVSCVVLGLACRWALGLWCAVCTLPFMSNFTSTSVN